MGFISKAGRTLRRIGLKVAHGARVVGNKVALGLTAATPILAAVNPTLGAAAAGAAGVAKGVAELGIAGEKALSGQGINFSGVKKSAAGIGDHAKAVQAAYDQASTSMRSALERKR